jgi:hypothetical protein
MGARAAHLRPFRGAVEQSCVSDISAQALLRASLTVRVVPPKWRHGYAELHGGTHALDNESGLERQIPLGGQYPRYKSCLLSEVIVLSNTLVVVSCS